MRALVLVLCLLLGGCYGGQDELATVTDGDGGASVPVGCYEDLDCELAAATCCDCPSFAVSAGDPSTRACTGVVCPAPEACPGNVRAACNQGQCELACVAMTCADCPDGYALDVTGCLSCTCAAPPPDGCALDTDCVATRADCCGCQQGGETVAVLASERASYEASLGCGGPAQCPGVDTCDLGAVPRCLQGRCALISGDLPPGACGRPDLPACQVGTVCTINADEQASLHGVGLCTAP